MHGSPGGSLGGRRITEAITRSDNQLGTRIADGRRNVLDIASQYQFSPERLRLYRDGAREFPQYNTVTGFTDAADHYLLEPAGGETMHIESAESGTYVVNYTMEASMALGLTQSLQAGDVLRLGPYNGTDGWFIEQRGADHDDTTVDIIESVAGTETTLASDVSLKRPTTEWVRYACEFGWYSVLNQLWYQTTTDSGEVKNNEIARTSVDGARGPETANLNLWAEIQADANTTGLGLEVGSMGMVTLGNPTSLTRNKPTPISLTLPGTADTWEPFYAIRIDPAQAAVNAQFSALDIVDYGPNATVEIVAVSVDADKTDASGWGVPEYHHNYNSAMQSTTSITQVPQNTDGLQTDLAAGEKPGGFTIATAVDVDGGNTQGTSSTTNRGRQEKKSVLASDHIVFLSRTGTSGTLWFEWDVDQNW